MPFVRRSGSRLLAGPDRPRGRSPLPPHVRRRRRDASGLYHHLHGQLLETEVHDPLMRPVTASYGLTPEGTAIIETAQACGLTRLSAEERNPLVATTYGVGELVAHAFLQGARRFIIGLGGSGTSDAGKGMLQGLTDSLAPGGMTEDILNGPLAGCSFVLASDVRNPLYGPEGAAHISPRKGATPEMVEELDRRARQFAEESARRMGKDTSSRPGAGAAGGLGYAFLQYLQATTQSGADLLLDLSGFDRLLADTDLVITGEGHADRQTLMGKLPERVMRRAQAQHVPVWLVAGKASDRRILAGMPDSVGWTALRPTVCPLKKPSVRKSPGRISTGG